MFSWPLEFISYCRDAHCMKSILIWNFSGQYFCVFGLNTKRYGVFLHIQFKCGKIRTIKNPNMDTFDAEAHLEPCEIYTRELFMKIVDS